MQKCWNEKKEERPTFTQLKLKLKAIAITTRRKSTKVEKNEEEEMYINDNMGPS